jgi:glycine/D-amino acid oxidase-like deaminating enzyme
MEIPKDSTDSAWQVEKSPFSDYCSGELPIKSKIVIIGTGFTGISAAYHVLNSTSSTCVTLLEARQVCSGATSRNGGHLTPNIYSTTLSLLSNGFSPAQVVQYAQFEIDNYETIVKIIREEELDCEFVRKEHYNVAFSTNEFEDMKKNVEMMRNIGGPISQVRIYQNPEASNMVGMKCEGLVVHTYSGSIQPYKMVTGLLSNLFKKYGNRIKLFTHTPVEKVENNTIYTNRGTIIAGKIVYATNGYTSLLLPQMKGVITPIRGQVIQSNPVDRFVQNSSFNRDGEYLSQRPTMKLILGGARRFSPTAEINTIDDSTINEKVSVELQGFCEKLGGGTVQMEWTGIMGFTKFGIPVVKEVDGGVICAGFSGHGMTRIFLSAKETARLVL